MTVAPHHEPPAAPAAGRADAYFRQYERWLLAYCVSRLGSRHDAEDALQSVYLNAWRALQRGTMPRHPGAWLFAVARNICHERLRERSQRISHEETYEPDELARTAAAPAAPPVGQLNELSAAVRSLPQRQKRALLLREWQGLSYEEIATELGVSLAAVEMLLFRARRSVTKQLRAGAANGRARSFGALAVFGALSDFLRAPREAFAALTPAKTAATIALVVAAPMTVAVLADRLDGNPTSDASARADAADERFESFFPSPLQASQRQTMVEPDERMRPVSDEDSGSFGSPGSTYAGGAQEGGPGWSGAGSDPAGDRGDQPEAGGAGPGDGGSPGHGDGPGATPSDPDEPTAQGPKDKPGKGHGQGPRGGGATPATPAVPATPHHNGTPATPATPAMPPAHSNEGSPNASGAAQQNAGESLKLKKNG